MRQVKIGFRILLGLALLGAGYGIMLGLERMKKPPAKAQREELTLHAHGTRVRLERVQTLLTGYGTARARRRSPLGVEATGRIVSLSPAVKAGALVAQGEELFQIDPRTYEVRADQAQAEVAALDAEQAHLRQQLTNDQRRLKILQELRDLAEKEFLRFKKLTEIEGVEARSRMEAIQQLLVQRQDQVVMMENALALHPIKIRQIGARIQSARARASEARLNLEKTRVVSPFAGRIAQENVELGQMVMPGTSLLTLVDDSTLELAVSLEGEEVTQWMGLTPSADNPHWFDHPPTRTVVLRWSENPEEAVWSGQLDRVEQFDSQTRTVTVIVTVDNRADNHAGAHGWALPLVEGMFCQVEIPGRLTREVVRLPRSAVSHDKTVFIVEDDRLKTCRVRVVRYENEMALINDGLSEGDMVLTSRPSHALDGMRVIITEDPLPILSQTGTPPVPSSPLTEKLP